MAPAVAERVLNAVDNAIPQNRNQHFYEANSSGMGETLRTRDLNSFELPPIGLPTQMLSRKHPIFREDENPMIFLDELDRYAKPYQNNPRYVLEILVAQSFTGKPGEWFRTYLQHWQTYADFEAAFKARYLDAQVLERLSNQSLSAKQHPEEDPLDFVVRKNFQISRFHPYIPEDIRVKKICSLMTPFFVERALHLEFHRLTELTNIIIRVKGQLALRAEYDYPESVPEGSLTPQILPATKPIDYKRHLVSLGKEATKPFYAKKPQQMAPPPNRAYMLNKGNSDKKLIYIKRDYGAVAPPIAPKAVERVMEPAKKGVIVKSAVRCYNCNELGHISTACPKPKKARKVVMTIEGTGEVIGTYDEETPCESLAENVQQLSLENEDSEVLQVESLDELEAGYYDVNEQGAITGLDGHSENC